MAAKGRIEIQCPQCGNLQLEPELAQSTYCRECGGYISLGKSSKSAALREMTALTGAQPEGLKSRVEVRCPSCDNLQLEPPAVKSTYCRKCGSHIQLEHGGKPGDSKDLERPEPSVLQKLESFFGVQRTMIARCFECTGEREVSRNATSTLCPKCGAYIDLQDYKITGVYTRTIRTGGRLIVTEKCDLLAKKVFCGYAEIAGSVRGQLTCSGDVWVRYKGKLSGSIKGKTVHIEKKCEAEFLHPIFAELVEIDGRISGQIISTRSVVIRKTGRLTGSVSARGFTVDKGGCFLGDVSIGETG